MKDSFERTIDTVRISVTDRCNYRCSYCMPVSGVPFIPHDRILRLEEIRDFVQSAVTLGINKIRLTGGEPLLRKGIVSLVEMISQIAGIEDFAMTTNGSLLSPMALKLKQAGLRRINISLDTIDPVKFKNLTHGGDVSEVLAGIDAAINVGLTPVKINIVIPEPGDDSDAVQVEAFAMRKGLISRRIHQMDLQNGIFRVVQNSTRGKCQVCNRIRLTSDGFVRSCLFSEASFNIRDLGVEMAIRQAILMKPEKGSSQSDRSMNSIGG